MCIWPSVPQLMGSVERPTVIGENRISPNINFGVKLISMGLLVDEESPIIWSRSNGHENNSAVC